MEKQERDLHDFVMTPGVWRVTFVHKGNKRELIRQFHVAEEIPMETFRMHTHDITQIMRVR